MQAVVGRDPEDPRNTAGAQVVPAPSTARVLAACPGVHVSGLPAEPGVAIFIEVTDAGVCFNTNGFWSERRPICQLHATTVMSVRRESARRGSDARKIAAFTNIDKPSESFAGTVNRMVGLFEKGEHNVDTLYVEYRNPAGAAQVIACEVDNGVALEVQILNIMPKQPRQEPTPAAPGNHTIEERLRRLHALFHDGLITESEYTAKKGEILREL